MTTPVRRVLLVGFMGSGKSTVAPLVADALGWRAVDFDRVVEDRAGATVAEIFARDGETRFRALEADVGRALLEEDRVVLAAGGGWAAEEGRLDDLPPGTVSVWLRVAPERAVARASAEGGVRPLLAGPDPVGTARRLLRDRAPRYARADHEVDTTGLTPEDVTRRIVSLVDTEPDSQTDN